MTTDYKDITDVSIHAPTWGATFVLRLYTKMSKFQSTHPHGVRPYCKICYSTLYCFNPRTHMGCDFDSVCAKFLRKVFQSTHPHGVRRQIPNGHISRHKFQSTHPHGVRLSIPKKVSLRMSGFNPRTHMGCDSST